jgi:hypothetical protein
LLDVGILDMTIGWRVECSTILDVIKLGVILVIIAEESRRIKVVSGSNQWILAIGSKHLFCVG